MVEEAKDRVVNTDRKIEEQDYKREPHERDESPDGQGIKPRGIIQQAASDLENGLVDTENYEGRGTPGIEQAVDPKPGATGQAEPQPERHRDMRDHDAARLGNDGKKE
ncbi:hypothetical protein SRABI118_02667 [Massilia sp. Bi118]|uniref:hypothetical protein n=1 Tax=Massilia sp. Bi118 TaxID=2822346 RepID=UPI001D32155F|nr:hypothetical protein [Massilia sp. Bi118]CAH0239074.1 hypothetical protein SRABI118_02667 [Massilia sp. Bi118]